MCGCRQGGDLHAALHASLRPDGLGVLVPVSRGISRAADAAEAARSLRDAINAVRTAVQATSAGTPAVSTGGPVLALHQISFLEAATGSGVLQFGDFTLKSGRQSPYFFNAGTAPVYIEYIQ